MKTRLIFKCTPIGFNALLKFNLARLFLFVCLLSCTHLFSQKEYRQIDTRARAIKTFKNLADLSAKLTTGYTTDLQKVRSIFIWITNNIAYDTREFHANDIDSYYKKIERNIESVSVETTDSIRNTLILDTVIKRKKAICDGYARLFKTLCIFAKIKAEVVEGMGKTTMADLNHFDSDHAWNAVMIDKKWQLLDACWASGYSNDSTTTFTKEFEEFYFLTPPKQFAYSHFPENVKHLYYDHPITKQQFISMPKVYPHFFKSGFEAFFPVNGVVNAKTSHKVQIILSATLDNEPDTFTGSDTLALKKTEKKYYIDQKIAEPLKESLTIYYKNAALLEYKLVKE